MKTKIYVNPAFSHLSEYIEQIPSNFWTTGEVLHNGRNEVRKVLVQGETLVIKYFRKVTWANRLIFATVRKSKAQRSFENSRHLVRNGIITPSPVAYIDIYKNGLLYQSFYISIFLDFKPVKEFLGSSLAEAENGLKAFSQFSYELHRLGIFHGDYNINNVLYQFNSKEYRFALIDNNRIKFRNYTRRRGFKNMNRLQIPIDKMGVVSATYSELSEINGLKTLLAMTLFRLQFQHQKESRKHIKALLRG